jgi:DNA-binding LytR/AlgR family response regulator
MNCIIVDDEDVSRKFIEGFVVKTGFLELAQSFSNPIEALSFLSNNKVDLIFLDIEMPEMNGIEFIKTIKDKLPQVILTTSHKEFAIDAFEHDVTDFLVKPVVYSRFYKAVSKAKEIFEKQTGNKMTDDTVFVKKGSSIVSVKKTDILWVEALGDYITLNTRKGKYTIHSTMKAIEDKLAGKDYIRVHRSFIVRIDIIDSIDDNCITYGDKMIPIGKSYKEPVMKRLNIM